MAQLFVLSGPDVGRSFEIQHGDTVGRSPDCIITLKHASVSRSHARFVQDGGRWLVIDAGSRNGLVVDHRRVERAELSDMDEFQIGELLVRFRTNAPELAPAPAPTVAPAPPSTPPRPAESEADELVLEGGDEEPAPARTPVQPPRPGAPPPRKLDENLLPTQVSPRVPPPAPPTFQHSMLDTGFGRPGGVAGASVSRAKAGPGERILQYHKVESGGGLGGVELAQLSGTTKLALFALATLLAAAIAWFAFRVAASTKERLTGSGGASDESVESPER